MSVRDSSNRGGVAAASSGLEEAFLRLKAAKHVRVLRIVLSMMMAAASGWAQTPPPSAPPPEESATSFGAITPYLGLTVDEIEFPGVEPAEAAALLALTPLKVGEPLTRDALHDAIKALFASGRFSDIQAEAERAETTGVRIRFLTAANYFVGIVTVDGVSTNPTATQMVSATRLQLGSFTPRIRLTAPWQG